jgi:hypothetical protein
MLPVVDMRYAATHQQAIVASPEDVVARMWLWRMGVWEFGRHPLYALDI